MDRRTFLGVTAASMLAATGEALEAKIPDSLKVKYNPVLNIRFLGTGSAGGLGKSRSWRRHSSVLVDNNFLIDFTAESADMIPPGIHPESIFYTHSHKDHFQPADALRIGIKKVYLSHTWYDVAVNAFKQAVAAEEGLTMPEIIPLYFGMPVQMDDVTVLPLIANHPTEYLMEESQIYLLEKGKIRLLYATDTSGIPGKSARMIGIDRHKSGYGITGLIMEATMGIGHEDDFRLFAHSSVALVQRTVKVMQESDRLHLPEGIPVYITHMSKSLHGSQEELDATLPYPIRAAYDGLEVNYTAP